MQDQPDKKGIKVINYRKAHANNASYWKLAGISYGVDAAFEFQKGKFRIYSAAQTGIALAGISAGPFAEWSKAAPGKSRSTDTGWVNYYTGADLRVRIQKGPETFAAGIYGKVPVFVGNENENNEFDWWDWEDWD